MSAPALARSLETSLLVHTQPSVDGRWWVWLGQQRLIGFSKQADANALAINIHKELERTGHSVELLLFQAVLR